jgi:hypothetical protein
MRNDIQSTLAERGKTHGNFHKQSQTAQSLKEVMRQTKNWENLSQHRREALEMIATKISRILNGDPLHKDTWHDIAGYATLVEDQLNKEGE